MPAKVAPNNDILYGWATGEDYWGGPMNDNLAFIDTLMHPYIKSMSWSSPPPDAVDGDRFVVATNPTGTWAGQQGNLAVMIEAAWKFYEPKKGWRARLESTGTWTWFNGVDWVDEGTGQSSENPTPGDNPREYHVSATIPYQPKDAELILLLPVIKAMVLPKAASGSAFTMESASPGYAVFDVQRNGISIGKIIVEQGQYEASFAITNSVTFAAGDRIAVYAPAASIANFQNFGFVLKFDILGTN